MDLIYSFDATYREYMSRNILYRTPKTKDKKYNLNQEQYSDSRFYGAVLDIRYRDYPYRSDMLQLLMERSFPFYILKFPLWTDLFLLHNYTMKMKAKPDRKEGILRKMVFKYQDTFHWYICIDIETNYSSFLSKLLASVNLQFLAFSEVMLYSNLTDENRFLVDTTTGQYVRKHLNWMEGKTFQHAMFTDFDILVEKMLVEIDEIHVFSFHGKIYLSLEFYHNEMSDYTHNKHIYNLFIYHIARVI